VTSNQAKEWRSLDNAAKIFPPNSNKRDTKVFRLVCELKEQVDEQTLQQAAQLAAESFPGFQVVLKRGLFWYYLESSTKKPVVRQEYRPPCSPLYHRNIRNLLYEITYFQNRINLEVYHALTDGTGALQFLRTIVFHYLMIRHAEELKEQVPAMDYDASHFQRMADSFQKYYHPERIRFPDRGQKAYQIRGAKIAENRVQIIEGLMPVSAILQKAHEHHTTVTVLLAALFICSIHEEMAQKDKKRPVILHVPVNLRKYFSSESARNFFGVINTGYDFQRRVGTLEDVIEQVDKSFHQQLTPEQLAKRMNYLSAMEHHLISRVAPLGSKDFIMRMMYRFAEVEYTATLSNMGQITMPDALKPYIRLFDIFISTNKIQICMCSFEDNMMTSFTAPFVSTDIQRIFFRKLSDMGVPVTVATNRYETQ